MYLAGAAGLVVLGSRAISCMNRLGGLHGHWIIGALRDPRTSRFLCGRCSRRSQGPLRLLKSRRRCATSPRTSMLTDLSNPNSAVRQESSANRRPALNPFFARVAPAEWIDWTKPKELI